MIAGQASSRPVPIRATGAYAQIGLPTLVAALIGLLALDNMLLLAFLGWPTLLVTALAVLVPLSLACLTRRMMHGAPAVSLATLATCLAIAAMLLVLGGEGRLSSATADWQVRDAVLRDMAIHRWPFDYWLDGRSQILRAPVGMYLLPALLGAGSQIARDWTLLAHNALLLGLLLAVGSTLFATLRARSIALLIFVTFSGLDILGVALVQNLGNHPSWDHLEHWGGYQYSAHVTQIFWVPQHALAGWTTALAYLLWRRGIAPVGVFAASIPLVALWSPFAVMGALPFALFAGLSALMSRTVRMRDIAVALLALATAVPALLYLGADAGGVGAHLLPIPAGLYLLIMLLEVAPFAWPILRTEAPGHDRQTAVIATLCLLLMPFLGIGASIDFQMRASIMPLAIVAILFAGWAIGVQGLAARLFVIVLLALGSVTDVVEIARALRFRPAPVPACSLQGVWTQQTGMVAPHDSYFATLADVPAAILRAAPHTRAGTADPAHCWDRPWQSPRNGPIS